jgi:hypothetical protein
MRSGGVLRTVLSAIRVALERIGALTGWGFGASEEELPLAAPPRPGPPHGPVPAIDLRRERQRSGVPPGGGVPPS